MVRCLALFALLATTPVLAEDGSAPPQGVSTRAEVTVTILRAEEIGPVVRAERMGDSPFPAPNAPDRQYQHLPSDQIRIDFY
jgi:hypothetical protein